MIDNNTKVKNKYKNVNKIFTIIYRSDTIIYMNAEFISGRLICRIVMICLI